MHELSIALGILDGVDDTARREGLESVSAVHVRIGELSGISRDALTFVWELAAADTIAAGSRLCIEDVATALFCERCEGEVVPPRGAGLVCPTCHEPAPRIVRGRELELTALEVPD